MSEELEDQRESELHRIKFPIGDWSDDGHGKCEWFIVESNKPVQAVREAHFDFEKKFKVDIGDICGLYEERNINPDIVDLLKAAGIDLQNEKYCIYTDPAEGRCYPEDLSGLMELWLDCLKTADPQLNLTIASDTMPTLNFYGVDNKGRHLNVPGYGLFV